MAGLYEVVVSQSYFGQECLNRYNYLGDGSSGDVTGSYALLYAMGMIPQDLDPPNPATYPNSGLFWNMRVIQSDEVVYTSAYVKNIYTPTDFFETPFLGGTTGNRTGQGMAPFNAYGYRTTRTRTDIRRATKRFVGTDEVNVDAGGVVVRGTPPDAYTVLGTSLAANLEYTVGTANIVFQPVVVGRDKVALPDTDPVRYTYRYYPTLTEQEERLSIGFDWEFYPTVRSQTSRQYGRGR